MPFINYRSTTPTTPWQYRRLLRAWAGKARGEPGWAPPYWPRVTAADSETPIAVRVDAMGISPARTLGGAPATDIVETLLATAVVHPLGAGHAAATHFYLANDPDARDFLLSWFHDNLPAGGLRRLYLPAGPHPHLARGATADLWQKEPIAHAPATPPYLIELLGASLEQVEERRLYRLSAPFATADAAGVADMVDLAPSRLATDLLPLLQTATATDFGWPPLDAPGARALLNALAPWPLHGRLALVDGRPAGFVLLQPDGGAPLRRAGGGRTPWARAWLRWRARRPFASGRLLLAAVHPDQRGRRLGRQLLAAAAHIARGHRWRTLMIGPVTANSPAANVLAASNAEPCQPHRVFQLRL